VPHYPPRLPAEAAWGICARAARSWTSVLLGQRPAACPADPFADGLPRLALVYLPHYLVDIDVTSRKGPGVTHSLLDGCSGAFAIADFDAPPDPGEPEAEVLPALLSEDEAGRAAVAALTRLILGQRSRGPKPTPLGVRSCRRVDWPFWVYYFARSRGRLDIRACDARTGDAAGNRAKAGILKAMVAAAK